MCVHQDREKRIFTLNQRRGRQVCHLVEGEKQGDRGEVGQVSKSRNPRSGGTHEAHPESAQLGHDFHSRQESCELAQRQEAAV